MQGQEPLMPDLSIIEEFISAAKAWLVPADELKAGAAQAWLVEFRADHARELGIAPLVSYQNSGHKAWVDIDYAAGGSTELHWEPAEPEKQATLRQGLGDKVAATRHAVQLTVLALTPDE